MASLRGTRDKPADSARGDASGKDKTRKGEKVKELKSKYFAFSKITETLRGILFQIKGYKISSGNKLAIILYQL